MSIFKTILPFIFISILALTAFILSIISLSSGSDKNKINDLENRINENDNKINEILNGTRAVGNSLKLEGKVSSDYATAGRYKVQVNTAGSGGSSWTAGENEGGIFCNYTDVTNYNCRSASPEIYKDNPDFDGALSNVYVDLVNGEI